MDLRPLKDVILENQRLLPPVRVMPRDIKPMGPMSSYVLVGMRRVGKTYMMYADAQTRLAAGLSEVGDLLMVNFEDERVNIGDGSQLGAILDAYYELYPGRKPVFYLDEIQNVPSWQRFARRLADQGYRVVITGSNARMLSSDIYAALGGRYMLREVNPFSFREYLAYHEKDIPRELALTDSKGRSLLASDALDYMRRGGLAEVYRQSDAREYLTSLYQKILLGDIVARNELRSGARVLRLIGSKLAESLMQPLSVRRMASIVSSAGIPATTTRVSDYLQYMREAFLIFAVPNMASKAAERETTKKRYFTDNGILNLYLLSGGEAKLTENIVAAHLYRRFGAGDHEPHVFYYSRGTEVDFVVPEASLALQVCSHMEDDLTRLRESRALLRFIERNPGYEGRIVTLDASREETVEGVPAMPLWQFLLD